MTRVRRGKVRDSTMTWHCSEMVEWDSSACRQYSIRSAAPGIFTIKAVEEYINT